MKKNNRGRKAKVTLTSLLLVCVFLFSFSIPVFASATSRIIKRNIAIVFDNSGSMYEDNSNKQTSAWCRAIYSMEVFASMMNDEDRLSIYPMWPIEIGKGGTSYDMTNPLSVTKSEGIEKIRQIYTPSANETPIEAIDEAYQGLMSASGYHESWMIILTDGDVFYTRKENTTSGKNSYRILKGEETITELSRRFTEYGKDVNILYLGIGKNSVLPPVDESVSGNVYVDQVKDSVEVLLKLTDMCNRVFGRDSLELEKNQVTFDLPMKKLIIFAQGENLIDLKLGDYQPVSSFPTHYSENEKGSGNYGGIQDKTLQGVIATYENIPSGSLSVTCGGNLSSLAAYYEPGVDLKFWLVDEYGEELTDPENAYPGTYQLWYGLVDSNTQEVTDSKLLGKTSYEIKYKIGENEAETIKDTKSGFKTIELKEGDVLDAEIAAEYLTNYKITATGDMMGWPLNGWTILKQKPYKLTAALQITQDYYQISKIEEGDPIILKLALNENPLDSETMDTIETQIDFEGVQFRSEKDYANSAIKIWLQKGDYKDGEYKLSVKATGIDYDGNEVIAVDSEEFQLKKYQSWFKWMVLGVSVLLLGAITWFVLTRPAWPRVGKSKKTSFKVDGAEETSFGKPKVQWSNHTIKIVAPSVEGVAMSAIIETRTLGKLKDPKAARQLEVLGVRNVTPNVNSVRIHRTQYIKNDNGGWVPERANKPILSDGNKCVLTGTSPTDKNLELSAVLDFNCKE